MGEIIFAENWRDVASAWKWSLKVDKKDINDKEININS